MSFFSEVRGLLENRVKRELVLKLIAFLRTIFLVRVVDIFGLS